MAKKRKRKARKARKNPRRRRRLAGAALAAHRRKRGRRSNPRRRRRHAASAAPRRTRRRRAHRNPAPRRRRRRGFAMASRRSRRRGHRRNPGKLPPWAMALLGAGTGLVLGAVGNAAASKIAPGSNMARYGASALGALGGAAMAKKHPILGGAIAAGSLAAGFMSYLSFKLQMLVANPDEAMVLKSAQVAAMGAMQNVAQMRGLLPVAQMSAVLADNLGAVVAPNYAGLGAVIADGAGVGVDGMGAFGDDDPWGMGNSSGSWG